MLLIWGNMLITQNIMPILAKGTTYFDSHIKFSVVLECPDLGIEFVWRNNMEHHSVVAW